MSFARPLSKISLLFTAAAFLMGTNPVWAETPMYAAASSQPYQYYIAGMTATQGSPSNGDFQAPKFVQVQANQNGNGATGRMVLVDPSLNGVPVLEVTQVNSTNNGQIQFLTSNHGWCLFDQNTRVLSCNLGDLGSPVFNLDPNALISIAPIGGASVASNIFSDFNAALTPEWATISRDMECRTFPNRACHDNAYPDVNQWQAFITKFNQVIADTNQLGYPLLSQHIGYAASAIALVPVNPANPGQMKITRDQYTKIKSGLEQARNDLLNLNQAGVRTL